MQTIIGKKKFSREFINANLKLESWILPLPKQGKATGRRALLGNGSEWVSYDTLLTPLTPFSGGCKPSVYRHYDTLTPLNIKFSRARARDSMWQDKSGHRAPRSNVNGFQCSRTFALLLTSNCGLQLQSNDSYREKLGNCHRREELPYIEDDK